MNTRREFSQVVAPPWFVELQHDLDIVDHGGAESWPRQDHTAAKVHKRFVPIDEGQCGCGSKVACIEAG
jgi:hypothetical protein